MARLSKEALNKELNELGYSFVGGEYQKPKVRYYSKM